MFLIKVSQAFNLFNIKFTGCVPGMMCSYEGVCTADRDVAQMSISEGCGTIYEPGSSALTGFFGSEEDYKKVANGSCTQCYDELFGGVPRKEGTSGLFQCNLDIEILVDLEKTFNHLDPVDIINQVDLTGPGQGEQNYTFKVRFNS